MENLSICTKPLPDTVGLSHTAVNVSQGECGNRLCQEVKVSSWAACDSTVCAHRGTLQWAQLHLSPACLSGTKSTTPLPKPATQSSPISLKPLKEIRTGFSWGTNTPECHQPQTDLDYFPNHLLQSVDILIKEVKPNLGKIPKWVGF